MRKLILLAKLMLFAFLVSFVWHFPAHAMPGKHIHGGTAYDERKENEGGPGHPGGGANPLPDLGGSGGDVLKKGNDQRAKKIEEDQAQAAANLEVANNNLNDAILRKAIEAQPKPIPIAMTEKAQDTVERAKLNNPRYSPDPLDLAQLPDGHTRYHFRSERGEFRDSLEKTYSDISKIPENNWKRTQLKHFGQASVQLADQAYARHKEEDAEFFKKFAETMLDLAVGIDPVTGFGRSSFELLTGRNLITGQTLSGFERSVAFLGVVTAGVGPTVVRTAQAVSRMTHIFERAVHIVEERHKLEIAMRDGKILYAKVEHLISETIIKNKVVNIHTAEKINYDLFNRHLMLGTPPFQAGTHVIQGRVTQETSKFMRFHGDTNQVKGWLFKESSVKGLTREQILEKFSVPHTTTERFYFSEVTLPRGAEYFRGYVQGHGGAPSGAVQWYVKDIKTEWFANKKLIE